MIPSFSYPAWDAAASYVMDNFVVVGDFNEDGIPDLAVSVPARSPLKRPLRIAAWYPEMSGT